MPESLLPYAQQMTCKWCDVYADVESQHPRTSGAVRTPACTLCCWHVIKTVQAHQTSGFWSCKLNIDGVLLYVTSLTFMKSRQSKVSIRKPHPTAFERICVNAETCCASAPAQQDEAGMAGLEGLHACQLAHKSAAQHCPATPAGQPDLESLCKLA